MKTLLPLLASIAAVECNPVRDSYLTWAADSFIKRGVNKTFAYEQDTLYRGYQAAYELTGNETYLDWIRGQIDDVIVQEDGTIKDWNYSYYATDNYRMGNSYLWLYEHTGEEKYKSAAGIIREQMNRHPRLPQGSFWHGERDFNQMWLDGIYMADSFYAKWTKLFDSDNKTAWDDILTQFVIYESHTRDLSNGLLRHAYDQSRSAEWADPIIGTSPLVWDRAVGWYIMSLLEIIPALPQDHRIYPTLVDYFQTVSAALLKAQDESGGWWLVMGDEYVGREGNYIETSGSSMFVYGFLKAIKLGLLPEEDYYDAAKKGWELLASQYISEDDEGLFQMDGIIWVGLPGSYEEYVEVDLSPNDYKGVGPFMLAAYEWETW